MENDPCIIYRICYLSVERVPVIFLIINRIISKLLSHIYRLLKQGNLEIFHCIKASYANNSNVDYLLCLNTLLNSHFTEGTFNV